MRVHGWFTRMLVLVAVGASLAACTGDQPAPDPVAGTYRDARLSVPERVDDLLRRMSVADKVGQMTQVERGDLARNADLADLRIGSILSGGGSAPIHNTVTGWADMYDSFQRAALRSPLGIPIIYGTDAVHGNNNLAGATIFPHNIGLGATRDPGLAERIGRATAEEVAATGVDWTFGPCLCVVRDDRWGRSYESFGEKPELVSAMSSIITGFQGPPSTVGGASTGDRATILATAKHYLADGGTTGGDDQGDTQLSEQELRAIHLPPYRAAVERGVASVMVSFSSWNGTKLHAHQYLITDVLKKELGFRGFVVSDWAGIDQIDGRKGFTRSEIVTAANAGIDMFMVPRDYVRFVTELREAVSTNQIPMSRVDDANRRILTAKFELGVFEHPYADRTLAASVGSAAHRQLAREAVARSQVLLKNDGGVLPLTRSGKLFVAGRAADDAGMQSGGWTLTWQGQPGPVPGATTILQAIKAAAGPTGSVTYSRDGAGIDASYSAAIAVVGETPYAEYEGDRTDAMQLDPDDLATIDRLRSARVPVIVVLVSGRPLDVTAQLPGWNALLAAWLPGSEGAGVADVLFGDVAPTGKLPVTWMRSASQQPINDGDGKPALFPYDFGLTYPG